MDGICRSHDGRFREATTDGRMWPVHQAGLPPEHWTETDVKLVAIEHTVATDRVALLGTRIGSVLGLIRSFDASLERAINLKRPIKVPREPGRLLVEKKG